MNAFEQPQDAPESEAKEARFKKGDYVTWSTELLERAKTGQIRLHDPVKELVLGGGRFIVQSVEGDAVEIRLPTNQTLKISSALLAPFPQNLEKAA